MGPKSENFDPWLPCTLGLFLVTHMVKSLPAIQETWIQSLS